jgi:hypothetical protein
MKHNAATEAMLCGMAQQFSFWRGWSAAFQAAADPESENGA